MYKRIIYVLIFPEWKCICDNVATTKDSQKDILTGPILSLITEAYPFL